MSMLVICCHGNAGIWSKKCRFRWVVKPAELVSAADISRSIRYGGELKDCFGSTLLFNVDVVGYLASYPSLFPCTYHVYHMSLHRSHRICRIATSRRRLSIRNPSSISQDSHFPSHTWNFEKLILCCSYSTVYGYAEGDPFETISGMESGSQKIVWSNEYLDGLSLL